MYIIMYIIYILVVFPWVYENPHPYPPKPVPASTGTGFGGYGGGLPVTFPTQDELIDLKDAVPSQFHNYLDVFSDEKATRFPKSTSWDHKIEMKPGFEPKSFKIYPMTPKEDTMTKEFINDNLAKGYIRPSKSPMATPFFFVNKKRTSKK